MKFLVFCYGTLKSGYHNHRLLEDAKFIGKSRTTPDYKIYCNGRFPYMIEVEGGVSVEGEVYEVDAEQLARLDRLEGHPRMYLRKLVNLVNEFEQPVEAYIYQHSVEKCRDCGTSWNGVK